MKKPIQVRTQVQIKTSPPTLADRVSARIRTGATVSAIASSEKISVALAQIMVEELTRKGLVAPAESLCASGLGACGSGSAPEVALHCSGCPLVPLRGPRS